MKKIMLSVVVIATVITATAQSGDAPKKTIQFNAGAEVGLPVGDFKNTSSIGFGVSLQGEYAVAEKVGATLSAGYLNFSGKTIDLGVLGSVKSAAVSIVPVLVGAKIHFSEKVYGHAQAGISFFNNDGGSAFTFAPAIGVMASRNIDLSLKYQAATKNGVTLSFLGLKVAYNF